MKIKTSGSLILYYAWLRGDLDKSKKKRGNNDRYTILFFSRLIILYNNFNNNNIERGKNDKAICMCAFFSWSAKQQRRLAIHKVGA